MRAFVIPRGCTSIGDVRRIDRADPEPRPGQVRVRIRAASLNRRDLAVASGTYFGKAVAHDTIPLSDGAGEVDAVGDGVTRFTSGDRVVACFEQIPPTGPPFAPCEQIGSPLDGMLTDRAVFYEDGVLPFPDHLSFEEAACLPVAALTAWNALIVAGRPITAGEIVLVLGTGGVSIFALQFATAIGARVIATSSSDDKLHRAIALGASDGINYIRVPEWQAEVRRLTDGRGVDCVVEIGGVGTMERSIDSLAHGGKIALIGVLTGRRAPLNPYGLMWKEASIHGIHVGSRHSFEQMNRAVAANKIRPVIDRVFPFDEVIAAFRLQESNQFVGKIVIRI